MFRDTDNLQDVFDCDGWLMCINDEGTPFPAYSLRTIHGAVIQAGTLIVGTADIEDGAITNAKIGSLAVDDANIANAAIKTLKVGNLQITTGKLENNAATRPGSAYTAGAIECPDGDLTTIQTVSSFISKGGAISIWANYRIESGNHKVHIYRDGTELVEIPPAAGTYIATAMPVHITNTPGAGTYTFTLRITVQSGLSHKDAENRSLIVHELTK